MDSGRRKAVARRQPKYPGDALNIKLQAERTFDTSNLLYDMGAEMTRVSDLHNVQYSVLYFQRTADVFPKKTFSIRFGNISRVSSRRIMISWQGKNGVQLLGLYSQRT